MRTYTFLLLRPDYAAATFGHDTFCAYVRGATVEEALDSARADACRADDQDQECMEDYHCLFCTDGHVRSYQDGAGGVSEPLPRKPRGGRGEHADL